MLPHGESACAPLPDFLALRPMMRGMIAALLALAKPQKSQTRCDGFGRRSPRTHRAQSRVERCPPLRLPEALGKWLRLISLGGIAPTNRASVATALSRQRLLDGHYKRFIGKVDL
jgi:hypothetical protein